MGFVANNLEKVQKRTHLNGCLEEKNLSKVIEGQLVFYPLLVNNFFIGYFTENLII